MVELRRNRTVGVGVETHSEQANRGGREELPTRDMKAHSMTGVILIFSSHSRAEIKKSLLTW